MFPSIPLLNIASWTNTSSIVATVNALERVLQIHVYEELRVATNIDKLDCKRLARISDLIADLATSKIEAAEFSTTAAELQLHLDLSGLTDSVPVHLRID